MGTGAEADLKKSLSNARRLPFPRISCPGEVRRAQRHVPDSITTLRIDPGIELVRALGHCPHCHAVTQRLNL